MEVWISKYALFPRGIFHIDAEIVNDMAIGPAWDHCYSMGHWHTSYKAAAKKAEQMRTEKIKDLKEQIKQLEKLKF